MAERRMFSKSIIDTDLFLEMPLTTQALYFHLSLRADDEGFISAPKKLMRMVGCSEDDLKLLIAKQFIIPFDSGVVVIKHWRIHNYIQKDRFKKTTCLTEKSLLSIDEVGAYQFVSKMDTSCIQTVSKMDTQDRIDKDRIGKDSIEIEEDRIENNKSVWSVRLSVSQISELSQIYGEDVVKAYIKKMEQYQRDNKKRYKTPYETLKAWLSEDSKPKKKKPTAGNERSYSNEDMEELERKLLAN